MGRVGPEPGSVDCQSTITRSAGFCRRLEEQSTNSRLYQRGAPTNVEPRPTWSTQPTWRATTWTALRLSAREPRTAAPAIPPRCHRDRAGAGPANVVPAPACSCPMKHRSPPQDAADRCCPARSGARRMRGHSAHPHRAAIDQHLNPCQADTILERPSLDRQRARHLFAVGRRIQPSHCRSHARPPAARCAGSRNSRKRWKPWSLLTTRGAGSGPTCPQMA